MKLYKISIVIFSFLYKVLYVCRGVYFKYVDDYFEKIIRRLYIELY